MKISVIVPAYNVEDTIGRCLDSVLAQDYPLHEIIVVEDCSTDGTLEKLQKYQGKIRLIKHDQNQGLGMTRGEGIMSATGDYIYCVDSDDYLHPDAIGYLVRNADGGDIITGGLDCSTANGLEAVKQYYKYNWFLCNRLIKKSLFEKAPHSKIRLYEDADTLPRLLFHCEKATYAPLMLYYYNRGNMNGLTNSSSGIKTNVYKLLVMMHNYHFFLENAPMFLETTRFHQGILKYITLLYAEATKDPEEFNRYDKETNEILHLIAKRLSDFV